MNTENDDPRTKGRVLLLQLWLLWLWAAPWTPSMKRIRVQFVCTLSVMSSLYPIWMVCRNTGDLLVCLVHARATLCCQAKLNLNVDDRFNLRNRRRFPGMCSIVGNLVSYTRVTQHHGSYEVFKAWARFARAALWRVRTSLYKKKGSVVEKGQPHLNHWIFSEAVATETISWTTGAEAQVLMIE